MRSSHILLSGITFFTSLILFFIPNHIISQNTEREILEKRRVEIKYQAELLELQAQKHESLPYPTVVQSRGLLDADEDGMEDDWELANGLDPNDNRDAWQDMDGDFIINLFEFQLKSNPNLNTSPEITNFDPDVQSIDGLIGIAEGGTVVIRVPEGDYSPNALHFYGENTNIMIQGGWNASFTDHNPKKYVTTFNGTLDDEILYIGTWSGTAGEIDYLKFILEGLHIKNGGGTFGNVTMIPWGVEEAVLSIYNCKLTDSASDGVSFMHWVGTNGYVLIANTELSNNGGNGLRNHTTENSTANWKFLNLTTSLNLANGLRAFTLSGGEITLKTVNLISKLNANLNMDFSSLSNFNLEMFNSNYTKFDILSHSPYEENVLDTDPGFANPLNGDFTLNSNSPCVNTGLDVGIPFAESAPEMGAYELGDIMSAVDDDIHTLPEFSVLHNPVRIGQPIQLILDYASLGNNVRVQVFDIMGKLVFQGKTTANTKSFEIPSLSATGLFSVQLTIDDRYHASQSIVVIH